MEKGKKLFFGTFFFDSKKETSAFAGVTIITSFFGHSCGSRNLNPKLPLQLVNTTKTNAYSFDRVITKPPHSVKQTIVDASILRGFRRISGCGAGLCCCAICGFCCAFNCFSISYMIPNCMLDSLPLVPNAEHRCVINEVKIVW